MYDCERRPCERGRVAAGCLNCISDIATLAISNLKPSGGRRHEADRRTRCRHRRHECRLRIAGRTRQGQGGHHRRRRGHQVQLHAVEPLGRRGLAQAGRHSGRCTHASGEEGHRLRSRRCRTRRAGIEPGRAARRTHARLRLSGHRHRPAPGLRRSAGTRSVRAYAIDLHHRTCPDGLGRVRAVPERPWTDRDRRRTGRQLLRSGLRVRDDPRRRSAQAQAARPRADDLCDQRTLCGPHGPRRRRRFQGAARIRAAPAPHQVDHQREDHRSHCERGPGHEVDDRGQAAASTRCRSSTRW
jgi:hypothetical protein